MVNIAGGPIIREGSNEKVCVASSNDAKVGRAGDIDVYNTKAVVPGKASTVGS